MHPADQHDAVADLDEDVGGGKGVAVGKGAFSSGPEPFRAANLCYKFYYGFRSSRGDLRVFLHHRPLRGDDAGPLLAVTIRHASRRGVVAAPLLVLGHAILEAALVCLLLFGLTEWIRGDARGHRDRLLGCGMLLADGGGDGPGGPHAPLRTGGDRRASVPVDDASTQDGCAP